MSEVQVYEKIIPAIADLEVTLVMDSRPKKLIKSRREAAEVSWERKETVEDEDVPLPSEETRERARGTSGREYHPSHRRLGRSTVMNSRHTLIKELRKAAKVSWDLNGREQWKMFPYHQKS